VRTVVKIALATTSDRPTVVFSPDGNRVAILKPEGRLGAGIAGPTVWETATGNLLYRIEGHPGATNIHLVFSPDGKRIATSDLNAGSIKLWDAANGRELLTLKPNPGRRTLAFSPDGHHLVLQYRDGEDVTWNATPRAAK
jgi:WD40 repeat protein